MARQWNARSYHMNDGSFFAWLTRVTQNQRDKVEKEIAAEKAAQEAATPIVHPDDVKKRVLALLLSSEGPTQSNGPAGE